MEQRAEWRSWSQRAKSKGVNDAAGLKIIIHPLSKMDDMLDGREAMNWSTGSANMAHKRKQCQWGWKWGKHISVGLSDKQRKGKAEHVPIERRESLLVPPESPHREGMVTKWHPPGLVFPSYWGTRRCSLAAETWMRDTSKCGAELQNWLTHLTG